MVGQYEPSGQGSSDLVPAGQYWPDTQAVGSTDPATQKKFSGHSADSVGERHT